MDIKQLKEIASVKTEEEVNIYLGKGWKILKVFEPKEYVLARYEIKRQEK